MGLTKTQQINAAIGLLEHHGYIVTQDYSMLINKWVAFWQKGMDQIRHGKVIEWNPYLTVLCKNGQIRCISMNDVIEFFDNKEDCYKLR